MKTRYYILLLLICMGYCSYSQNVKTVPVTEVPKNLNIAGIINKAYSWSYNDTTYYVIFSESEPHKTYPDLKDSISGYINGHSVHTSDYDMVDNEFYFYHFTLHQDILQLKWKIYDYVKECPFDIHFKFAADAFTVTDLDNNGQAEIWLMYALSCTSDVSPDDCKLIMYEGKKKYAIRGVTRDYETNPVKEMDSRKEINANFVNGNPDFLNFALVLWKQNNLYPK